MTNSLMVDIPSFLKLPAPFRQTPTYPLTVHSFGCLHQTTPIISHFILLQWNSSLTHISLKYPKFYIVCQWQTGLLEVHLLKGINRRASLSPMSQLSSLILFLSQFIASMKNYKEHFSSADSVCCSCGVFWIRYYFL